jgi:hypothetical protein
VAGFLYFRSGDPRPIDPKGIERLGLGYAFSGSAECREINSASPSGKPGVVFADPKRHSGRAAGYHADAQTWRKLPIVEGRPEIWVGYWNDAKPGPEDLERQPMLAADVAIRLADGNSWQVPKVREFNGVTGDWECLLPSLYDYGDNGKLFPAKPLAAYAHLWDVTTPVAMALCFNGDGAAPVTDEQVQEAAMALLRANYVVDMPELVLLGALSTGDLFANIVMGACRGKALLSWIDELQKKSDSPSIPSGSSTSVGAGV